MTVEAAWDDYRLAVIRFWKGLETLDDVRRKHKIFAFLLIGKTQGEA